MCGIYFTVSSSSHLDLLKGRTQLLRRMRPAPQHHFCTGSLWSCASVVFSGGLMSEHSTSCLRQLEAAMGEAVSGASQPLFCQDYTFSGACS